tara:strand:- start:2634 stop:4352 length:1719 start_codon:yes stop_codon:yes gene_type:complete
MIKEFAFGTHNRHHFAESSKMDSYMNMAQDTFMSLYDYDEHVLDYVKDKNSLSGYDGIMYMPDEFILDVDGSNPEDAMNKLKGLLLMLDDMDIPSQVYFSGTGFHVHIPQEAFRWKPCDDLHLKVKEELKSKGIFDFADPSVTDKTRLIRVPNTLNSKSNLWKIQVNLNSSIKEIMDYAVRAREIKELDHECDPVFDVLERKVKPTKEYEKVSLGRQPDPVNYPCIQSMLEGTAQGQRHQVALRLAAHFRWLYPEDVVRNVMEQWRQRVDNKSHPFTQKEMDGIVTNCYEGHDGSGYRYGCSDIIMDEYCKNTCKLYKSKKSQTMMDASSMEDVFLEFLQQDKKPINLGALYGQDFPIYPGEVVIVQAPPKSMKTMLLQNWVNSFKKPTYFIEMEMSPRQIWSRFVMIEMGWNDEQLKEHYAQMQRGMAEKFNWLTVEYGACYPFELEKRLTMLPFKPEIVVVDHIGLLKSKHKDSNMKLEEASQGLMELAVKNNVIVFAVSEISKTAFHEGMDISSSKGSFRIAYNANKVLSVTPFKNNDNVLKSLQVESTANREKEWLNITLPVNGVKIQ